MARRTLSDDTVVTAAPPRVLKALRAADPALGRAMDAAGPPVVRRREGGFAGLARIVVGQQLSVQSADAITRKLETAIGPPTPEGLLAASEETLRACGLSGPKMAYLRNVALAFAEGRVSAEGLSALPSPALAEALTAIKGIGPWTAAIYLLFCEGRQDVWPSGDLALLVAYQNAAGLPERGAQREFDRMAESRFAPHAGTAAHVLWTYYGHLKGRLPG
jgi:DNA-3-methyladenine glycosylase II